MAAQADGVRSLARGARVARVLVVDDEDDLRELMELTLIGMGLDVDVAADLAQAHRLVMERKYALCLTDMRLPDGSGLELLALITAHCPETPVAVITAYGSADNAVAALKAGAFDYLAKPVSLDAVRALIRAALQLPAPGSERAPEAAGDIAKVGQGSGLMIGRSPAVEAVRASIAQMARSMAPVAISGESGTGKELAARLIHQMGARPRGPFVAVNCGAIPENLMESEFFGYRKGAFTGAEADRTGFFMAADGGTLFLDEVADLPLAMQVKLLRAIQEKRIRKVGSVTEEPVDTRIISATHQDLVTCVSSGRFRQDLFYRLNVIELRMPPLRERLEDVGELAQAILERLASRNGPAPVPKLASVTLRFLESYAFPGNVRELENILERAMAFSDGRVINVENLGLRPIVTDDIERERSSQAPGTAVDRSVAGRPHTSDTADTVDTAGAADVPALVDADGVPRSLPDYLDQLEREAIGRALDKTGHNRTAAAKLLGITFRALRYRMQRLEIN
ncbi:MAG TPA: sigma-54 dependent transcriptional regulator [Lautropia sp.]|nr:sigma-54 dependent transcriptional regulator [Lautropia sp.]